MAEYFYEGEIVSVTVASISMGSKRIVGIVRSIRGNFISNQGSMTVDLGNRYSVEEVPFISIPDRISKLIGAFYIDVENIPEVLSLQRKLRDTEDRNAELAAKLQDSNKDIPKPDTTKFDQTKSSDEDKLFGDDARKASIGNFLFFNDEVVITKEMHRILVRIATESTSYSREEALISNEVIRSLIQLILKVCIPLIDPEYHEEQKFKDFVQSIKTKIDNLVQCCKPTIEEFLVVFVPWLKEILEKLPGEMSGLPQFWSPCISNDKSYVDLREFTPEHHKQLTMISNQYTIWNAVGSACSDAGKRCWSIVNLIVRFLVKEKLESPWMAGKELGVFGETPLHIALLFNPPNDIASESLFRDLWDMCPKLHDSQYKHALYEGENVLHVAIYRNFGVEVIEHIVNSDVRHTLMDQEAVGTFFNQPKTSSGYGNVLGGYPLSFAACAHNVEAFKILLGHQNDSNPVWRQITSSKKENLLHLLVLTDKFLTTRAGVDKKGREQANKNILSKYKGIIGCMQPEDVKDLKKQKNSDHFTPLHLAAAEGTVTMFLHLFDGEEIETAWNYGPVICAKMYIDGVDTPLNEGTEDKSILEILIQHDRKDIFAESLVYRLIECKWNKYGKDVYKRKFVMTLVISVAVVFLPMVNLNSAWIGFHIISHMLTGYLSEHVCEDRCSDSLVHKFIFNTWGVREQGCQDWLNVLWKDFSDWLLLKNVISFWTRDIVFDSGFRAVGRWIFSLFGNWDAERALKWLVPPCLRVLFCMLVFRVLLLPFSQGTDYQDGQCPALIVGFNRMAFTLTQASQWLEAPLYSLIGCLLLAEIASLIMALESGWFVLLFFKIIKTDLPVFFMVYVVFLVIFTHAHFLASNNLHAGVMEGMDSMWRIFQAMVGDFDPDITDKVAVNSLSSWLVTIITTLNYFLMAVVRIQSLSLIMCLVCTSPSCPCGKPLFLSYFNAVLSRFTLKSLMHLHNFRSGSALLYLPSPLTDGRKLRLRQWVSRCC